ncbi:MAG TPA: helix-turn-helix transcriptional regulator [Geminicoccaceae bacterium]|nr:helix-turn-helix transcriptional regulator [Geminicoccaceae bacterium]
MPVPEFLTTKEVAALLRIKERKVYELVAARAIPVSRVTGKLLFPREMVEAWVWRQAEYVGGTESLHARPPVLAGSHDPLLEWALRESGSELAAFFDGSLDGLARLASGKAIAAGLHVYEPEAEDWNRGHLERAMAGVPVVLVEWAWRIQGLVVPPGNPKGIAKLGDLAGRTLIPRQKRSGSHLLLDYLMRRDDLEWDLLELVAPPARSEADVALAIVEGKGDAGFAVETVARQFRLGFVPLFRERYDLAVWRRDYFEPPLQKLLSFARTAAFQRRAEELGGYDVEGVGSVHYNAP